MNEPGKEKRIFEILLEYRVWFFTLLLTDGLCALFLWLADIRLFRLLSGLLLFSSAAVCICTVFLLYRREKRRERLYTDFLDSPDPFHTEQAAEAVNGREQRQIRKTSKLLEAEAVKLSEERMERRGYEEYIESWAHEIKTPLSLITLMLDSRSDEMSEGVRTRLNCSQIQIQRYVEQILYYSRLKADHKDYVMEHLSLAECCSEALEEHRFFLQAYGFQVTETYDDSCVFTDRRGLLFLLGQVISNAVKYRKTDGTESRLQITAEHAEDGRSVLLSVTDNGIGVMKQDLPFIFDKGFCSETGESGRKSTGMGLYLVRKMADNLEIEVSAESEYGAGFTIRFRFCETRED